MALCAAYQLKPQLEKPETNLKKTAMTSRHLTSKNGGILKKWGIYVLLVGFNMF
jgi:hypothetical protein